MLPDTIPRSRLCHTPTLLEAMNALSGHLGGLGFHGGYLIACFCRDPRRLGSLRCPMFDV